MRQRRSRQKSLLDNLRRNRPVLESLEDRTLPSVQTFPIPSSLQVISDLTRGPNGDLWAVGNTASDPTNQTGGAVLAQITTAGKATAFSAATTYPSSQFLRSKMATGSDHNLWFTEAEVDNGVVTFHIGTMTPQGQVILDLQPTVLEQNGDSVHPSLREIVADLADGNLYVPALAPDQSSYILQITPSGTIQAFTVPQLTLSEATGVDANGNIWFPTTVLDQNDHLTTQLTEMNTSGTVITSVPIGIPRDSNGFETQAVNTITVGPDNNVWFTLASLGGDQPSGEVGRLNLKTGQIDLMVSTPAGTRPGTMTAGPDGTLYFMLDTGTSGNAVYTKVGRINANGQNLVQIPLPVRALTYSHITLGPDNALWFFGVDKKGAGVTVRLSEMLTWTGKGDHVHWSDPKNWLGKTKPTSLMTLIFPAGAPKNTVNNIKGLSLQGIDIKASGYTISGVPFTVTGAITNEAGTNRYKVSTRLANTVVMNVAAGRLQILSPLSGPGGISVTGNGTLALNPANSYKGGTVLQSGVVTVLAKQGALGTGSLELDGGTLKLVPSIGMTLKNSLVVAGNASIIAGNGNALMPGLLLTKGIQVKSDSSLTVRGQVQVKGNITGAATLTLLGQGTATKPKNAIDLLFGTIGAHLVADSASDVGLWDDLEAPFDVQGQAFVDLDGTGTGRRVRGAGAIHVSGNGVVRALSDNPTFTGSVTLTSGRLVVQPSQYVAGRNQHFLGAGTVELDGGTLQTSSSVPTVLNNPLIVSGSVQLSAGNSRKINNQVLVGLTLPQGLQLKSDTTVNVSGSLTVVGDISGTGTLTLAKSGGTDAFQVQLQGGTIHTPLITQSTSPFGIVLVDDLEASLDITGQSIVSLSSADNHLHATGAGTITVDGAGTLQSLSASTYTGAIIVNPGTVMVGGHGALGTGALTINGGAFVTAGPSTTLTNAVTFGGGSVTADATKGTLVFSSDVTLGAADTLTLVAGSEVDFLGNFTGSGTLNVTGTGVLGIRNPSPNVTAGPNVQVKTV
jgi:autotransporter-associated beta strand protein